MFHGVRDATTFMHSATAIHVAGVRTFWDCTFPLSRWEYNLWNIVGSWTSLLSWSESIVLLTITGLAEWHAYTCVAIYRYTIHRETLYWDTILPEWSLLLCPYHPFWNIGGRPIATMKPYKGLILILSSYVVHLRCCCCCCASLLSYSAACVLLQQSWTLPLSSTWHGLGHSGRAHVCCPGGWTVVGWPSWGAGCTTGIKLTGPGPAGWKLFCGTRKSPCVCIGATEDGKGIWWTPVRKIP